MRKCDKDCELIFQGDYDDVIHDNSEHKFDNVRIENIFQNDCFEIYFIIVFLVNGHLNISF